MLGELERKEQVKSIFGGLILIIVIVGIVSICCLRKKRKDFKQSIDNQRTLVTSSKRDDIRRNPFENTKYEELSGKLGWQLLLLTSQQR